MVKIINDGSLDNHTMCKTDAIFVVNGYLKSKNRTKATKDQIKKYFTLRRYSFSDTDRIADAILKEKRTLKDNRISYNIEPIEVNGTIVYFSGKGDRETSVLKVYRFYGDITLFDEAIQNFCIVNIYNKCEVLFTY